MNKQQYLWLCQFGVVFNLFMAMWNFNRGGYWVYVTPVEILCAVVCGRCYFKNRNPPDTWS